MLSGWLIAYLRPTGLCMALVAVAMQARAAEAEFPPIEGAEFIHVAANMRLNGTATHIREFHAERPYAEVLKQCRSWLGEKRVEGELSGWRILARKNERSLTTIRIRAAGPARTIGTLSEASLELATAVSRSFSDFTLPAETEIGSDVTMDDPGKRSRLLTFINAHSVGVNVGHFRASLQGRGYRLQHDLSAGSSPARGRSLWFVGEHGEALMVVVDLAGTAASRRRTAVTLNLVRHAAGVD